MKTIKQKVYDWKNRLQDRHMLSLVVFLVAIIIVVGLIGYYKEQEYMRKTENDYNMAFNEMVNNIEKVQTYLAKSIITIDASGEAETLTQVWKEASLAQSHLAQLPISNEGLSNTSKFLNQVSDYSYSLSRKNFNQENLSQEDLDNLTSLYKYSIDLNNTLNQISNEIEIGEISWKKMNNVSLTMAKEVSNIDVSGLDNIEQDFHDYAGLIYDGAFSEHITNVEKRGLNGEDILSDDGENIIRNIYDDIENVEYKEELSNGNIDMYQYEIKFSNNEDKVCNIGISKKGGKIVFIDYNKTIGERVISNDDAINKAKDFLKKCGYDNMQETYYIEENGNLVINFAYQQNNVIIYSDLIKVKVALDDGSIIGIETTGYLNSHYERNIENNIISKQQATEKINKDVEIENVRLAMIPTKYKTENLCWEVKVKSNDREFLVYINAKTAKQEDILLIVNSDKGTLTM